MTIQYLPAVSNRSLDKIFTDYLSKDPQLLEFTSGFPSLTTFESILHDKKFSAASRKILVLELQNQNDKLDLKPIVSDNINALLSESTHTVTTGHQLCLFTGPLYFIYKIASTIKLAQLLAAKFPDQKFVPVYWMASEDHDFAEVNHAYVFGNKIEWQTDQEGAVGPMKLTDIGGVLNALQSSLGLHSDTDEVMNLLKRAYEHGNLAEATRFLVNELFGRFGLVILDANSHDLKHLFSAEMKSELLDQPSAKQVEKANAKLLNLGYLPQVNPRDINLFFMEDDKRKRIEKRGENEWGVVGENKTWNAEELMKLLETSPEKFSPNVIMRPLYQETILPNIAYIGGPGEIAYWLQLKGVFEYFKTPFPLLIARDSALFVNERTKGKLAKLDLPVEEIFLERGLLVKKLINAGEVNLDTERKQGMDLFELLASKAKNIDVTLEVAAQAEGQKFISSIEQIEKKMLKALRNKEQIKLQQLDKILNELFPEGVMQERHDNYFQYRLQFGSDLIDRLIDAFNPLENRITVLTA